MCNRCPSCPGCVSVSSVQTSFRLSFQPRSWFRPRLFLPWRVRTSKAACGSCNMQGRNTLQAAKCVPHLKRCCFFLHLIVPSVQRPNGLFTTASRPRIRPSVVQVTFDATRMPQTKVERLPPATLGCSTIFAHAVRGETAPDTITRRPEGACVVLR